MYPWVSAPEAQVSFPDWQHFACTVTHHTPLPGELSAVCVTPLGESLKCRRRGHAMPGGAIWGSTRVNRRQRELG